MAYIRKRGRQLVLVHGQRNPDTQKVEQHILFTLYSKGEALEAVGKRGNGDGVHRFRSLLESRYPDIKFDWKKIRKDVKDNMNVLPDLYDYRDKRLRAGLRPALVSFAKSLIHADPQWNISAAELVEEHRHELEFIAQLISWRLELSDKQERSKWTADNPFYWRYSMPARGVPPEAEEMAAAYWERRELDQAEAVFRLLTEAFHPYAEGHNYLGLIALEREQHEEAVGHFERTVELGRKMFPKRIAKKRYWQDLSTRPYMRGLRNLVFTYNTMGHYEEALAICDKLDKTCGDDASADVFSAAIYMNTKMWRRAHDKAAKWRHIWPNEAFVAGLSLLEQGKDEEALPYLLHGILNLPRTARMLAGIRRTTNPTSAHDVEDHNAGVSMTRNLHAYLKNRRRKSLRFLRDLLERPEVVTLANEVQDAESKWSERQDPDREYFYRMTEMRKFEFAEIAAGELV